MAAARIRASPAAMAARSRGSTAVLPRFPARRARRGPRPCRAPRGLGQHDLLDRRRLRPGDRRGPRARQIPRGTSRARPARRRHRLGSPTPISSAMAVIVGASTPDAGRATTPPRRGRGRADGRRARAAQRVLRRRCPRRGERVDDHLGGLVARMNASTARTASSSRRSSASMRAGRPSPSWPAATAASRSSIRSSCAAGRASDRRHALTLLSRGRRTLACRSAGRAPHETVASAADAASDHKARRDREGEAPAHATTRTARPRPGKLRSKPARNGRRVRP